MLIGHKMTDGLNAQVGREYGAAMEYVAMGAWFEEQGLPGFANFFYKQGTEETEHGFKLVRYLGECGAHVQLVVHGGAWQSSWRAWFGPLASS